MGVRLKELLVRCRKNTNLFVYFLFLLSGLVIAFYLGIHEPISLLTLALVLIGAFDIIESNRATAISAKEMALKETPLIGLEPVMVAVGGTSKKNQIEGLQPYFLIKNIGAVPLRFELLIKELNIDFAGFPLDKRYENLGGYLGPGAQSPFFLCKVMVSERNILNKLRNSKNVVTAKFRYWSLFNPSKKYTIEFQGRIQINGIMKDKTVNFIYYKNVEEISEENSS